MGETCDDYWSISVSGMIKHLQLFICHHFAGGRILAPTVTAAWTEFMVEIA